jgi:multimeric flavodoxin WrbA
LYGIETSPKILHFYSEFVIIFLQYHEQFLKSRLFNMAHILSLLASGRRKGFTASLLESAMNGARSINGVEVEFVPLHSYKFGPCTSCFSCIRNEIHECILQDDMGGNGELMKKLKKTNACILADPVHFWGPSAQCHLFVERCYPFVWSGGLEGMPFMSVSCASNQGMHRLANENICKWAFTLELRYIGGLAVHTSYMDEAHIEAESLGKEIAKAALRDEKGREKYPEKKRYVDYLKNPWKPLKHYLENLSSGKFEYEHSLIAKGIKDFKSEEAVELLKQSKEFLKKALQLYADDRREEASEQLVQASALWTHATWKEFLEEKIIQSEVPEAYRPIVEQK